MNLYQNYIGCFVFLSLFLANARQYNFVLHKLTTNLILLTLDYFSSDVKNLNYITSIYVSPMFDWYLSQTFTSIEEPLYDFLKELLDGHLSFTTQIPSSCCHAPSHKQSNIFVLLLFYISRPCSPVPSPNDYITFLPKFLSLNNFCCCLLLLVIPLFIS